MLRDRNFYFWFSAFSSGQPLWKCIRRGSESTNFHLNITDSYYLGSKHSENYMRIYINMVGVNDGPTYSFWSMPELLVFPGFSRGATFRLIFVYISKMFHISTWIECREVEDNFLIHSNHFCGHDHKVLFCNKLYISPYPKIAIFYKSCII